MKLSGSDQEKLWEALLDAYRDYNGLKQMVKFKLDESLERFGGQGDLGSVVFNLIEWAEENNKILDLIWGAYEKNSDNESLQKVTFKFCSISRKQWEELFKLISQIKDSLVIESCLCQAFDKDNIASIDSGLSKINISKFNQEKKTLKENLIDKREKTKGEVPVVLAFAYYLSEDSAIKQLQDELKTWTSQVAVQLNIKLDILKKNQAKKGDSKQLKIRPYLQLLIESKGSDEFNLEAELVIEKDTSEEIVKRISVFLDEEKVIQCSKTNLAIKICQLIAKCNKIHLVSYHYDDKIILELFLNYRYLTEPLELEEISIGLETQQTRWLGYEYKFLVRSLDRLNNQEYLNLLENKWQELKASLAKLRNDNELRQRFEEIPLDDNVDWTKIEYELLEQRKEQIGINCLHPLLNSQYCKHSADFFIVMMRTGLPFAFWLRKNCWEEIQENNKFTDILTIENLKCLNKLLESVRKIRREAYIHQEKAGEYIGYHLGFLCDNPHRLPSKYDFTKMQDDALVFGV